MPPDLFHGERQWSLIAQALYFHDEQIGFALFGLGPRDGPVYGVLNRQISSALKGALLVQQVEGRARELEQAYKTLQDQQQILLINEKMASLGRITAGIAREMNTPW